MSHSSSALNFQPTRFYAHQQSSYRSVNRIQSPFPGLSPTSPTLTPPPSSLPPKLSPSILYDFAHILLRHATPVLPHDICSFLFPPSADHPRVSATLIHRSIFARPNLRTIPKSISIPVVAFIDFGRPNARFLQKIPDIRLQKQ